MQKFVTYIYIYIYIYITNKLPQLLNFFLLYMTIKHLYFLEKKSKLQPISFENDKFLFGMLYINLLNLVWFWNRIWEFYKFWSFRSSGFCYLCLSRLILILHFKCFLFRFMWFFVFLLKVMIFGWLIFFGLISINYLFGFNIKDNRIRYHNFAIVPYFKLSILLLLRESHIAIQIWSLICLPHIMVFVYIFAVYISFECMCIYNYWEFCFINLRIVNYFVSFGNYAIATQ